MIKSKQIPYMLELLNDESPDIRKSVIKNLTSFGTNLKKELQNHSIQLNSHQKKIIKRILLYQKEQQLLFKWPYWLSEKDEYKRLEKGIILLSEFVELGDGINIKNELDRLAREYRKQYSVEDPLLLARFLFKEIGLKGDEKDYYSPQNCNLSYVLQRKKGIPISLASVYMLVGARLGLKIEGCNFPGHFLARINIGDEYLFVDCFHFGEVIGQEDIFRVKEEVTEGLENILSEKVEVETIIRRYLANLIRMYQGKDDEYRKSIMIQLFKLIENNITNTKLKDITPEDIIDDKLPKFETGQIIRHKRYGYRGVVVDFDIQCMASEDWYYANHTQPNLFQPWYHVLVDETEEITYVAEANIQADNKPKEIIHPLVEYFFSDYVEGSYIRNDNPWPDTEY